MSAVVVLVLGSLFVYYIFGGFSELVKAGGRAYRKSTLGRQLRCVGRPWADELLAPTPCWAHLTHASACLDPWPCRAAPRVAESSRSFLSCLRVAESGKRASRRRMPSSSRSGKMQPCGMTWLPHASTRAPRAPPASCSRTTCKGGKARGASSDLAASAPTQHLQCCCCCCCGGGGGGGGCCCGLPPRLAALPLLRGPCRMAARVRARGKPATPATRACNNTRVAGVAWPCIARLRAARFALP